MSDADSRKTTRLFVISERGAAIAVPALMTATGGQDAIVQVKPFVQACSSAYSVPATRNTVHVRVRWEG